MREKRFSLRALVALAPEEGARLQARRRREYFPPPAPPAQQVTEARPSRPMPPLPPPMEPKPVEGVAPDDWSGAADIRRAVIVASAGCNARSARVEAQGLVDAANAAASLHGGGRDKRTLATVATHAVRVADGAKHAEAEVIDLASWAAGKKACTRLGVTVQAQGVLDNAPGLTARERRHAKRAAARLLSEVE